MEGQATDAGRKRRERDTDFEDARDQDEEIPVPTEPALDENAASSSAAAPAVLKLQDIWDLLQKSVRSQETHFAELKGDVRSAKTEAKEAKIQAAKATTLSQETKTSLEALERRVAKLETNPAPAPPPGLERAGYVPSKQQPQRDWDRLGGENGDTLVITGFRRWADSEERRAEWERIKGKVAPDMIDQIQEVIFPKAPGPVILVKLKGGENRPSDKNEDA